MTLCFRLYELFHKCTSPPVKHLPRVDLPRVQSGTTPLSKALWVGPQMHQSTSPPVGAIWNNSLFLRLYESVDKCTSPLVEHLPRVDDPCIQFRTTPLFRALWVGRPVHQSTSQTPATLGRSGVGEYGRHQPDHVI